MAETVNNEIILAIQKRMVAMGKTIRKRKQHTFLERFGKAQEPRVVRTMHEPIHVGFCLHDRYKPRCFWKGEMAYPIYRVVKRWSDEWRRRWYRVKTREGTFDLYEHRRWLSREDGFYRSYWFLAAEIEMVPVRHMDTLKAQANQATAASGHGSTGEAPGDRRRTVRGGSSSRRPHIQGSRPGMRSPLSR